MILTSTAPRLTQPECSKANSREGNVTLGEETPEVNSGADI